MKSCCESHLRFSKGIVWKKYCGLWSLNIWEVRDSSFIFSSNLNSTSPFLLMTLELSIDMEWSNSTSSFNLALLQFLGFREVIWPVAKVYPRCSCSCELKFPVNKICFSQNTESIISFKSSYPSHINGTSCQRRINSKWQPHRFKER